MGEHKYLNALGIWKLSYGRLLRIYCKNPLIIIHISRLLIYLFLFELVHLQPGKVVVVAPPGVVARKPVGNYEGLYCKFASHPAPGEKKGFKCRKVVNSSSFAI